MLVKMHLKYYKINLFYFYFFPMKLLVSYIYNNIKYFFIKIETNFNSL